MRSFHYYCCGITFFFFLFSNQQSDSEVMLGTILALIHAHKRCATVDKEAVLQLDAKLKEERKKAGDKVKLSYLFCLP